MSSWGTQRHPDHTVHNSKMAKACECMRMASTKYNLASCIDGKDWKSLSLDIMSLEIMSLEIMF